MSDLAKCRGCPAEILWAQMLPSGKRNPLDVAEVPREARGKGGVVAYNPATGRAMAVEHYQPGSFLERKMEAWERRGVTFHLSHFATCPERQKFKI